MNNYKDDCEMTAREKERYDLLVMKTEIEQRLEEIEKGEK